jgi:beta-glucosidase
LETRGNVVGCVTVGIDSILVRRAQQLNITCLAVPWGFRKLLQYIHKRYTSQAGLSIIVTEQGFCMKGENEMPIAEACKDLQRIEYYKGYLGEVSKAIKDDGIDISGYFAWSLAE